jgi:hypothetical protein
MESIGGYTSPIAAVNRLILLVVICTSAGDIPSRNPSERGIWTCLGGGSAMTG